MLKAAAGRTDGWNLGTNRSRSFSLSTLTFSRKPFPTGKRQICDTRWRLVLLTPCILIPGAVCSLYRSVTFHIFKMEKDSGGVGRGINTKVSASPSPSRREVSRKWCGRRRAINSHENHRLARRLPSPPPHPQTITGHPGSSPRCCCLWKLQTVA